MEKGPLSKAGDKAVQSLLTHSLVSATLCIVSFNLRALMGFTILQSRQQGSDYG